jgi:sphingomyelin phosphodiesterase
MCDPVFKELD